jgi:hypothetical protein
MTRPNGAGRGIEAEAQQQAQWNEWASDQDRKFMQSRPELKDPAVYQKLQKTAVEYLRSIGMTDQQIAQAWNTPHVRSAEAQQIIADAASAWAAREAIKNGKGRKPVPPVQKPGSAADRMSVSDVAIKAAEAAVAANPSVRNVAKLREVLG